MSSQDPAGSIPLFHAPAGAGYKLLELSPELVEFLESADSPTLTIHPSPTAALLKTPSDKTYSLRQKNTSNALILLQATQPTSMSTQGDEAGDGAETAPASGSGLRAIATVHETIELIPEAGDAASTAKPRGKWHEKFGRGR